MIHRKMYALKLFLRFLSSMTASLFQHYRKLLMTFLQRSNYMLKLPVRILSDPK